MEKTKLQVVQLPQAVTKRGVPAIKLVAKDKGAENKLKDIPQATVAQLANEDDLLLPQAIDDGNAVYKTTDSDWVLKIVPSQKDKNTAFVVLTPSTPALQKKKSTITLTYPRTETPKIVDVRVPEARTTSIPGNVILVPVYE